MKRNRDLGKLQRAASASAVYRRHSMLTWTSTSDTTAVSECRLCGMTAAVNANPGPDGINILGQAVSLMCLGHKPQAMGTALKLPAMRITVRCTTHEVEVQVLSPIPLVVGKDVIEWLDTHNQQVRKLGEPCQNYLAVDTMGADTLVHLTRVNQHIATPTWQAIGPGLGSIEAPWMVASRLFAAGIVACLYNQRFLVAAKLVDEVE